jgi:hypothetical protein
VFPATLSFFDTFPDHLAAFSADFTHLYSGRTFFSPDIKLQPILMVAEINSVTSSFAGA